MDKMKKQKKKMGFIWVILLVGIIVASIGIGYSVYQREPQEIKPKPRSYPPSKVKEKPKLKIVDLDSPSRPFAIMIGNSSSARPFQSGLQDAYIVYEIIVEGGITRYMALFLDQDTARIGSIRSARHYFLDYALENDAIYVHHGQSVYAGRDFSKIGLDRIVVAHQKTGWRDKSLKVAREHTLFTSIEYLKKGLQGKRITRKNPDLLLKYKIESLNLKEMPESKTATNVVIKYSHSAKTSYVYDAKEKIYYRYVNDRKHCDYVTKEQYHVKNIITYQLHNKPLNDGSGKGNQELDRIGKGTGYFISEGYAVPITWEKKARETRTIYKFKNGTDLIVNDGNTFIQIQPQGGSLEIS